MEHDKKSGWSVYTASTKTQGDIRILIKTSTSPRATKLKGTKAGTPGHTWQHSFSDAQIAEVKKAGTWAALVCGSSNLKSRIMEVSAADWEPLAFPSAAWQDGAMDGPPCLWLAPAVPVRQWVISAPKRLRGFLADRPEAVSALTKIFLAEIERLLYAAAGATPATNTPTAARPRLGAVSFLHRFGSALNRHVHLHACVADGVFMPPVDGAGCDAPPVFLPARLIAFRLFYQCETIPGLRTFGNLRLLRTSCPRSGADR